jgi:hypothetical protein
VDSCGFVTVDIDGSSRRTWVLKDCFRGEMEDLKLLDHETLFGLIYRGLMRDVGFSRANSIVIKRSSVVNCGLVVN